MRRTLSRSPRETGFLLHPGGEVSLPLSDDRIPQETGFVNTFLKYFQKYFSECFQVEILAKEGKLW
jgi:hypothetical protein